MMIGVGIDVFRLPGHFLLMTTDEIPTGKKQVPSDWLFRQRAYPFGSIDTKTYFAAIAEKREKIAQSRNTLNGEWQFCGPMNISGRVTDIEMTNEVPYIIYAGSASGEYSDPMMKVSHGILYLISRQVFLSEIWPSPQSIRKLSMQAQVKPMQEVAPLRTTAMGSINPWTVVIPGSILDWMMWAA